MLSKVDAWPDLIKNEHSMLELWERERIFDKLRLKNQGKPKWSFLDGPITANNPMGVHHAWGRTLKDAYQRFHAMLGRELRYQNGFDCQGLWVEVEVEKELGFKTKKDILEYGVDRFVEKCRERVLKYSGIQTQQSIRLGYWMDWDNSYYTMSDENNYTIWSFLRKCHDRDLIYRGHDVMPWCPRCGTGISQHEMHEGYREATHQSLYVKFHLLDRGNEALLVWTTTPWTLTSNVAAAVHPDLDYAMVEQDGQILYLAKDLVESVIAGDRRIVGQVKGKDLLGLPYQGPFDDLEAQRKYGPVHRVIPWTEVSSTEGTGIVHIAPGCGKEDHQLGLEHNLPALCPIDEEGVFLQGFEPFTGMAAGQVPQAVISNLRERNLLYRTQAFTHSYPHCWRCSSELLFRLVDEWFISMDPWREDIKQVARQINWIPSYGMDLELDWLNNMSDWMISKKRFWGLALPIWVCQECGEFEVLGGREELKQRAVKGWEQFKDKSPHKPFIDEVLIKCSKCGGLSRRVKDVGNPWLDAGIVPYSTVGYNSDRDYWSQWIPADLVLECFPGQFRNWFYSLLAMSTMMENRPPFKTLLGHALVRDEKGEEMHKSRGNAIWFEDAAETMGADIMRWLFCGHDPTLNINFGYDSAREVRGKFVNTLWNTYSFFVNYARLVNFSPSKNPAPVARRSLFDQWILSELMQTLDRVRQGFETFNARQSTRAVEAFVEQLSNWYIRHCRRRFWKSDSNQDTENAFETLYQVLHTLIRMIAPVMPFLAEEMYQNLVRGVEPESPESVHLCDYPQFIPELVDRELNARMDELIKITSLALSARERARFRVRQPLAKLSVCPESKVGAEALDCFMEVLKEDLNVKEVEILPKDTVNPGTFVIKPKLKTLGRKLGRAVRELTAQMELRHLDLSEALLRGEKEFPFVLEGNSVTIDRADLDIELCSPQGTSMAQEGELWLLLDTTLTRELELEGKMRDFLRKMQLLRKELNFEIDDRVGILYSTDSSDGAEIFERWRELLESELLALSMTRLNGTEPTEHFKTIEVDGCTVRVMMTRM